jgi:hypothetical protein
MGSCSRGFIWGLKAKMGDPVSLAIMAGIGIATGVAGASTSFFGQKQSGAIQQQGAQIQAYGIEAQARAQAADLAYKAIVAENNAGIARQNAEMETQAGEIAAVNRGMKTRAVIGQTKAQQAASGVDVNVGSFINVRAAESELGMVDALTMRSNAAKKAWADTVQATSFEAESELDKTEGAQALASGQIAAEGAIYGGQAAQYGANISATGSLLSGISSTASSAGKYFQTTGVPTPTPAPQPITTGSPTAMT